MMTRHPQLCALLAPLALPLTLAFCLGASGARAQEAAIPADKAALIAEAAPSEPPARPSGSRRVLVWITPAHLMPDDPHKGYCIPYGTHALKTLGEKTGAYQVDVSDDLDRFLPENIGGYDAIVMNNSSGPWITPTPADMERDSFRQHGDNAAAVEAVLRQSLLRYLHEGGGIVGIHYAIGANRQWIAFAPKIFGATYRGHPWNEEVGVKIENPDHPVVLAAFAGAESFRVADEIYQFGPPYDRQDLDVLLSLDTAATNMEVEHINRDDGDFALAWTRQVGDGRVFYCALGHRTEIYWNPAVLRLYLAGIQFATGDLPVPPPGGDDPGFRTIFNGRDLEGWDGDSRIWSVRDGVLTGQTTEDVRVSENTFLIWEGGRPRDFELRLQYRLTGGNSGIYFHATKRPEGSEQKEALVGPQADFSADHEWTGVLMEYTLRDRLAERGQKVVIHKDGRREVVGTLGDPATLLEAVRDGDWNEYRVVVQDNTTILEINGVRMCEVEDHDPRRPGSGHLALQVHQGPPMKVEFRNIRLKAGEQ
ncbi:hypothetical protein BH23VER1_BH23VER1_23970 [soil metagenome]